MTQLIHTEMVHVGGRCHVRPAEVIMLIADINYTTIYLANGQQFIIARTIGRVQESLHPHGQFIRLNKSHVVNLAYVLHRTQKGLVLYNNKTLIFSRRRKRSITKMNDNF